jgi:hypothetical protein
LDCDLSREKKSSGGREAHCVKLLSLVLVAGRRLAKLNTDNVMEGKHRYNILVFNLAFSFKVSIFKSRSKAAICTEFHSFSRKNFCVPARTFDTDTTWSCCVLLPITNTQCHSKE